MDDNKLLPKLSQNLLEILDDNEYYDITIEVGNDPHFKIFHAHVVILYHRSPYLKRIFSINKKKNDGTLTNIKFPNILPETFQIILRYIYGGRISLKEYDVLDMIKILVAANELSLQELIFYVQSFLIENKGNWMEQNFNLIYQTIFENDSFLLLQNYCTDLISNNSEKIFKSLDFSSIPEKFLISTIQNNNLQMSKIQVWENVLKWGIAQNQELPSNLVDYSKDNFDTLKNTLKQCIPFIKFYDLTSKEFLDKVLPYKNVLPEKLHKDLLKAFLSLADPNSKLTDKSRPPIKLKKVDSNIITCQHAELILKWTGIFEITDFKLLFRASRDGFEYDDFHLTCDNIPRTVVIAKVEGDGEILGGYNPIEWKSECKYGITKDSFIFSFKNKIKNHVLSRVVDENYAIYNNSYFGPSFGKTDLVLWGTLDSSSSVKASYENQIRRNKENFHVKELEIFQIV